MAMEMDGALVHINRERELTWWGAMLPLMKEAVPLDKFMGRKGDDSARAAAFNAAWDQVDRALARH